MYIPICCIIIIRSVSIDTIDHFPSDVVIPPHCRIIHLLNAIESTNGQHFKLFIQALQYAKDTKQTDNVAKYASVIEQMLNEWNAAVVDRRRVYSLFFDILSESQQRYGVFFFSQVLLTPLVLSID